MLTVREIKMSAKRGDNPMLIAVDPGNGYFKAVSSQNRAAFQSVFALGGDEIDFGVGIVEDKSAGHTVELCVPGKTRERLYVGDRAAREGRAKCTTLGRDRYQNGVAIKMTLAAAYLVGAEGRIELGYGLPLAYYSKQKAQVAQTLEGTEALVRVDDGKERYIKIDKVHVFPQGVGALFSPGIRLPSEGLYGVIDIGHYTTDYLLLELTPTGVRPYHEFCSSVEYGVSTAVNLFMGVFKQETGKPLHLIDAQQIWERPFITFAGEKVALSRIADMAKTMAARSIIESVKSAWADRLDFLDGVILVGGGAIQFKHTLKDAFPNTAIASDAQFANVRGFYNMLRRVCSPLQADVAKV